MSYPGVAVLLISLCLLAYKLSTGRSQTPTQATEKITEKLSKHSTSPSGKSQSANAHDIQRSKDDRSADKQSKPSGSHTEPACAADDDYIVPGSHSQQVVDGVPAIISSGVSIPRSQSNLTPKIALGHEAPVKNDMLPPPRPNTSFITHAVKPARNPVATLNVPSSSRTPPPGMPIMSQQRASGSMTTNEVVPTATRAKVILAPGHSPLDWAAKSRSANLAEVTTFQRVTPSQLKGMTGRKGKPAWSSWHGKVYNITPYLPFHPGGEHELLKAAGRDGTKLFMDVHPWVNWENMLSSCLIGALVQESPVHAVVTDTGLEMID